MLIRLCFLGVWLAACTPAPDRGPVFQIDGPAADTSFSSGAQDVIARVALSEHRDILK